MNNNILFIDDERNFLYAMKRAFDREFPQWNIHYVETASQAHDSLGSIGFDAVVCDVNLPDQDGFSFLQQLKNSPKTSAIPVIIITGMKDHLLKRRALDLGASDLLAKPVCMEDLVARLRNVLQLKYYQDQLHNHNLKLERQVNQHTEALNRSHLEIIFRLAKAAEYRDEETGNHIVRVGCYCKIIAEKLGMDREFVQQVLLSGPLHDIGKIGIPDSVLLKPGSLSFAERKIVEQHCAIGAAILMQDPKGMKPFMKFHSSHLNDTMVDNSILKMASDIAMSHHERWDGSGYPQGLAGTQIPLAARIVMLADIYDALRSQRPYKAAFNEEQTLEIMAEEAKRSFDPAVYNAFLKTISEFDDVHNEFSDTVEDYAHIPLVSLADKATSSKE